MLRRRRRRALSSFDNAGMRNSCSKTPETHLKAFKRTKAADTSHVPNPPPPPTKIKHNPSIPKKIMLGSLRQTVIWARRRGGADASGDIKPTSGGKGWQPPVRKDWRRRIAQRSRARPRRQKTPVSNPPADRDKACEEGVERRACTSLGGLMHGLSGWIEKALGGT